MRGNPVVPVVMPTRYDDDGKRGNPLREIPTLPVVVSSSYCRVWASRAPHTVERQP